MVGRLKLGCEFLGDVTHIGSGVHHQSCRVAASACGHLDYGGDGGDGLPLRDSGHHAGGRSGVIVLVLIPFWDVKEGVMGGLALLAPLL